MNQLLVYTAQSKQYFYCRDVVCEFVFHRGSIPLNPFRVFDYFLGDRVPRDQVRRGNHRLIAASDEVWVFGDRLADGVLVEIAQAARLNIPVRFFSIGAKLAEIRDIPTNRLEFETEVSDVTGLPTDEMRSRIARGELDTVMMALGRTNELTFS
ncbi:hypothetical protein [Microlunatus speluncae]|uniref:DUF7768 domain-containing protein n=1 Tax=Microlunatus speluncae TaxID=2594267 RepID=UPI0012665A00|nr:hypothetical protein [Microlunatus speluncae]